MKGCEIMEERYQKAILNLFEIPGKLYLLSEDLKAFSKILYEIKLNIGEKNNKEKIESLKANIEVIDRLIFYSLVDLRRMNELTIRSEYVLSELLDEPKEQAGTSYEH